MTISVNPSFCGSGYFIKLSIYHVHTHIYSHTLSHMYIHSALHTCIDTQHTHTQHTHKRQVVVFWDTHMSHIVYDVYIGISVKEIPNHLTSSISM